VPLLVPAPWGSPVGGRARAQVRTNVAGLAVALAAIVCTAVYQIWAGSKQKELGASSMQLMHQFAPHAAGLLALLVLGMEPVGLPGLPRHDPAQGTVLAYAYTPLAIGAILTTAVLGLLVSLSTFLVIGATSSVTFNVVRGPGGRRAQQSVPRRCDRARRRMRIQAPRAGASYMLLTRTSGAMCQQFRQLPAGACCWHAPRDVRWRVRRASDVRLARAHGCAWLNAGRASGAHRRARAARRWAT